MRVAIEPSPLAAGVDDAVADAVVAVPVDAESNEPSVDENGVPSLPDGVVAAFGAAGAGDAMLRIGVGIRVSPPSGRNRTGRPHADAYLVYRSVVAET